MIGEKKFFDSRPLCIALRDQDLVAIDQIMEKYCLRPIDIKVTGVDSTTTKFLTIRQLTEHNNSKNRAIKTLQVSGETSNPYRYIAVNVGGDSKSSFSILCEGEEDMVEDVKRKIDDILEDAKAWYHLIYKVKFGHVLAVISIFLTSTYLPLVIGVAASPSLSLSKLLIGLTPKIFVFAFVCDLLFTLTFVPIRRKLFPYSNFLIGSGKERYSRSYTTIPLALGVLVTISPWFFTHLNGFFMSFVGFFNQLLA
jgi:hypothetical protein